jgi:hypothetical protein
MTLDRDSIDFGAVSVDQTRDESFKIFNDQASTSALVGEVLEADPDLFTVIEGLGAFSIQPGDSLTVTVQFAPTAVGSESGSLSITHNAGNLTSPAEVVFVGEGAQPILMSLDRDTIDFGLVPVNMSGDENLLITNSASSVGPLSGTISVSGPRFSIVSGGGNFTLNPGQSWTVTVRFSPLVLGADTGSVSIIHDGTNLPSPTEVPLIGTGGLPIVMTLDKTSIDFGDVTVGGTADETILITNSVLSAGQLSGVVSISGSDFSIISGGGGFTLNPGQSWLVTVRFAPASVGAKTGTVTIFHDAGNMVNPALVDLTGNGIAPDGVKPEPT